MFLQNLRAFVLQDEAGDGTDNGGGGGGGGDPVIEGNAPEPAPAPEPDPEPSATPAPKPNTALSKNASEEDPFHGTPEKYRVMREDGTLDEQATLAKTAQAYNQLATKMGQADGVPPAAPGDYKINMPGEMGKQFDQEDPGFKEFLTDAHAAGFTQKQLDTTMAAFARTIGKLTGDIAELTEQECNDTLAQVWKTPEEQAQNYRNAFRAFKAFSGERASELELKYGNDPDMIWMFSQVGKQMQEGTPPPNGDDPSGTGGVDMAQVVKDLGSKDASVRKQAEMLWAKANGTAAKN